MRLLFVIRFAVIAGIAWRCTHGALAAASEEPEIQSHQIGGLKLELPDTWQPTQARSRSQIAQFLIPNPDSAAEPAEFTIFHFGGPAGGVDANIERWIGQFQETGRKVQLVQGTSRQGAYILADIAGTWKMPDGPPAAGKTIDRPGTRAIGMILGVQVQKKQTIYYLKLSGPEPLVASQLAALRFAIGAKENTEEPYLLKGGRIVRSEQEWKKMLTTDEYHVLREKGTERPFVNKFDKHFEPGTYSCAGCGQELFSSDTKFNSGCGWPAFYAAKAGDRVNLSPDHSGGRIRTEVTCARCGSHLGHIFQDAPQTPTGNRFCINSVALKFTPAIQEKKKAPAKEE